jgi:hypothetical protein
MPNDMGLKYLCTSMQWDLIGIHSIKIPCLPFLSLVSHNTSSMFCPQSIERVVNLAHVLILQRHLFLACFFNADEETLAANVGDPANYLLLSISDWRYHDTSLWLENLLPLPGIFPIDVLVLVIFKRGCLLSQKEAIRVRLEVIIFWWRQSIKFWIFPLVMQQIKGLGIHNRVGDGPEQRFHPRLRFISSWLILFVLYSILESQCILSCDSFLNVFFCRSARERIKTCGLLH